jgi:hypothetical protein
MIYLDNAATSWPKPSEVKEAMVKFMEELEPIQVDPDISYRSKPPGFYTRQERPFPLASMRKTLQELSSPSMPPNPSTWP